MTNLLAIALSVTIMARWYQFGGDDSPKQTAWQASMIIGTFVLLSVPLGLALRDIAARGFAERTIRNVMDEAARNSGGQLTTVRVERNEDVLRIDAVMLLPQHRPQLERELERKLEAVLAKPVEVSLRELLTADEKALANEQASLAQLRESVLRLQSVAERDAAQRTAGTRATEAMHQRVLAHFGQLEVLEGGQQARWQLKATAGLDVVQANRLERALAQGDDDALQVVVVPALQALPPLTFGDDQADLDAGGLARVEAITWALRRWGVSRVSVEGYAGNDAALALARAEHVAAELGKRGIPEATAHAVPGPAARNLALAEGATVLREARVRLETP